MDGAARKVEGVTIVLFQSFSTIILVLVLVVLVQNTKHPAMFQCVTDRSAVA